MRYSLDVNVLLYASDQQGPLYSQASEFLTDCTLRSEPLCLTWVTLMSYLRMVTHQKIFARPLTPPQAVANVEQLLLALPHVEVLAEEAGFWEIYRRVGGMTAQDKMVPDTHLAALLLKHGVRTLYSNDSDFKVFDFLEVRNPFRDVP